MNKGLTREGRANTWMAMVVILFLGGTFAGPAHAAGLLKVMKQGLGTGTVTSTPAGTINCGADCDENFATSAGLTLTAVAGPNSVFVGWEGNCAGAGACALTMSGARSVRAIFRLDPDIPTLADFTPEGIAENYLTANPNITNAGRFIRRAARRVPAGLDPDDALGKPADRHPRIPRILMPNVNAQFTFTSGSARTPPIPARIPMRSNTCSGTRSQKNFRFHEIVLERRSRDG